jgi:hypothetical protein
MSSAPWSLPVFVSLSSALTGVAAAQLKPPFDPIGIADQYFATLNANIQPPSTLANLAAVFQAVSDPKQGAANVLADPTLGPVARSIIKLWLLGSWYSPSNPSQAVKVVSAQAYKESLVWKIMQSHPMGYSMFKFGDWASPPPPLQAFIQPATPSPAQSTAPNRLSAPAAPPVTKS